VQGFDWLNSDAIISWSYDFTIKIWSISSGQTINGFNMGTHVWSLQLLSNQIHFAASIASTNSINIYSLDKGSLIASLQGHTGAVWNLLLLIQNNLMASASNDGTIRLWNLTSNTNKFIFRGHSTGVVGLKQVSIDVLASGGYDAMVKLWNITSGNIIRTLEGHTNWVMRYSIDMLTEDGQTLVSGSYDNTFKIWNWNNGVCLNTVNVNSQISSLTVVKSKQMIRGLIF
jgi:WD40 repeat protein